MELITTLGTETDKTGKTVTVKFCAYMGAAPQELLSFYYRSMADTLDAGHASSTVAITNACKAVYVEIDNKIVGSCVVEYKPDFRRVWIVLTSIDKDYRGRGLYKIIFDYLVIESKKMGAFEISSFVHPDNTKNIKARESVGMFIDYHRFTKKIT